MKLYADALVRIGSGVKENEEHVECQVLNTRMQYTVCREPSQVLNTKIQHAERQLPNTRIKYCTVYRESGSK